jgi:hypothetical protein
MVRASTVPEVGQLRRASSAGPQRACDLPGGIGSDAPMYRSAAGSGHAAKLSQPPEPAVMPEAGRKQHSDYTFLLNDLISYQSTGQGRTMIAGKFERA